MSLGYPATAPRLERAFFLVTELYQPRTTGILGYLRGLLVSKGQVDRWVPHSGGRTEGTARRAHRRSWATIPIVGVATACRATCGCRSMARVNQWLRRYPNGSVVGLAFMRVRAHRRNSREVLRRHPEPVKPG